MAKVFPAFYDPRKLVAELLSDREDVHTHHRRVVRVVRPERTRDDLPLTRPVATAFEQEVRDRELARRQPNSSFFDEERARCRMDTDGDFVVGVIEDQAPCERADVRSKPSVAQRDRLPQVGAGAPAVDRHGFRPREPDDDHHAVKSERRQLGSPFNGDPRATNAWKLYEFTSGHKVDDRERHMGGAISESPPVPSTAI